MPDFSIEQGYQGLVAGIDEAGRGPLAGPVVAGCVHIPQEFDFLADVRDSKKLSDTKRERLFDDIVKHCAFGIAIADTQEIDELNILQATFLAMRRAVDAMQAAYNVPLCGLLVDGNQKPKGLDICPVQTVVKGDDKSYSIACASILAKVTRDAYMRIIAQEHPHYGWASNMGYGAPVHLAALKEHGPCAHHRKSFAPVRALLRK